MKYRHNFTQHLSMNSAQSTHCCRVAFVRLTLLPVLLLDFIITYT